jgi:hypothetical protein
VAQAGKYVVDVSGGHGVQVGDRAVHLDTANGPTGTMTGPVTVTYGKVPFPQQRRRRSRVTRPRQPPPTDPCGHGTD